MAVAASAQDQPTQKFNAFKVNLAAGYAMPLDLGGGTGGFVYSIEPQYYINHHVFFGARFEEALVQRTEILNNSVVYGSQANTYMTGTLSINYAFGSDVLQPYAGVGVEFFHLDASTQRLNGPSTTFYTFQLPETKQFGGMIRGGIKYNAWMAELAANVTDNSSVTYKSTNSTLIGKNIYFSAKVGYTFGGRQR